MKSGKTDFYNTVHSIPQIANITFVRQRETKGLGHAVHCAKNFVGDEPFAVMFGDDVIVGEDPAIGQLIRAYEKYGKGVLGVNAVPESEIHKYGSLKVDKIEDNIYNCTDMVEKPKTKEEVLSLFSILGRCVLPPEIFDILETVEPGVGGEIQLTDAMKVLARSVGMTAVDFTGVRYDMGNKLGILKAQIEVGVANQEFGEEFKQYLKDFVKTL